MKILLVGEFSGFHKNLRDGLISLGNEVVLASTGDGWKKIPSDINWQPKKFKGRLGYLEFIYRQYKMSKNLRGFDVVQFISPYQTFDTRFGLSKLCYNNLMKNNKKSFFIAAGADPIIWQFWIDKKESKISNLINQTNKFDLDTKLVINLLSPKERYRTIELVKKANGLIPIMYEYAEPYREINNLCPTIPIPINCGNIKLYKNNVNNKITIFHGLNRRGAKGTDYIEKAFKILKKKYPNDLNLIIAGNMPYNEYLEFIKNVNVIIDQTNSYSLGINGLISLAQGKITMGGGEILGANELSYKNSPIINVKPDVTDLVSKIENLIKQKNHFPEMGRKSRDFVEKFHNHIDIAKKYIEVWESNN